MGDNMPDKDWLEELIYEKFQFVSHKGSTELAAAIRAEIKRRRPKDTTEQEFDQLQDEGDVDHHRALMVRNIALADYDKTLGIK